MTRLKREGANMKISGKAIDRKEDRLFRAYRELERLDGEHGSPVVMPYEVAEPLKVNVLQSIGRLEAMRGAL
jgi:hypothetical protein